MRMQQAKNSNDAELMAEYLSGDEEALNMVISNNLSLVYSAVYFMIGNQGDAEDVTQETFLKLWKNAGKYKKEKSFRAWLLTIARNTARDFLRKRKNFVFSDFEKEDGSNLFVENLSDQEPLPDEIFWREENKKIMEEALTKLSFAEREVVVLRYTSNMTFEEIGEIVGRPLDTVKSQHRRALIQIKKSTKISL